MTKHYTTTPANNTPPITIGIDQSLTNTGVTVNIGGKCFTAVIQQAYQPLNDFFTGIVCKSVEKVEHLTVHNHIRISNQVLVVDTFINRVLQENGLTKKDVGQVRMEALAFAMIGKGRMTDLVQVIQSYILYIEEHFGLEKLRLVTPTTVKGDYLGKKEKVKLPKGTKKKVKEEKVKVNHKDLLLKKFNSEHGTNLEIRSTKNPDEDAVDSYILATKIL